MSKQAKFCQAYPEVHAAVRAHFPDFDYSKCVGDRNVICRMPDPGNQVGHQQRAVTVWWAIEACGPMDLGLDIGSHRGLTPFCIHIDRFYDGQNAHPFYGGVISADLVADGAHLTDLLPPRTFPYVCSSHSLEHMPADGGDAGVQRIVKRWLSLLRPGGVLVMVVPDNDYWDVMASDKDHHHAWGHRDFRRRVLDPVLADTSSALVEYDTLNNEFSFNVVVSV